MDDENSLFQPRWRTARVASAKASDKASTGSPIEVTAPGSHVLGRMGLTKIQDRNLSRNQLELKVHEDGKVEVSLLGMNSSSVWRNGKSTPVEKGTLVSVNDSDVISLLPNNYFFRVEIQKTSGEAAASSSSSNKKQDTKSKEPPKKEIAYDSAEDTERELPPPPAKAKKEEEKKSGDGDEKAPALHRGRTVTWTSSFNERSKPRETPWDHDLPIINATNRAVRRIWLIRHGQSEGNVNKKILHTVADHAIPLSKEGITQAQTAGEALRLQFETIFGKNPSNAPVRMWVSPYKRTRETAALIQQQCTAYIKDVKEHVLLVEQQFGLFEGVEAHEVETLYPTEHAHFKKLIDFQGRFWARPPLGESRFDVTQRVHQAFGTFHRDADRHGIEDIVVVTHGVTLRAFLMMWLHQSPEWFEKEQNPGNCCIRFVDDYVDKGYVFKGFSEFRPPATARESTNAAKKKPAAPLKRENTISMNQSLDLQPAQQAE